jgi:hypothetical protein
MKFVQPRPFADPEAAAHKLLELANAFEQKREPLPRQIEGATGFAFGINVV